MPDPILKRMPGMPNSFYRDDGTNKIRAARGFKRRLLGRLAYILGVVLLVGNVIMFPPWEGISYQPDHDQPENYHRSGKFGLRNDDLDSPIWHPPRAHSPGIRPTMRWPWQSPSAREHVELSTMIISWRIAKWLFMLGLALKLWNGISARNRRDRFVDMAWSMSLGTAISILVLTIYGGFTAGYGLTDVVVVRGLSVGALLGLAYGAITFRTRRAPRSLFTVTEFAWFALGLGSSLVIMMTIGYFAEAIRGDRAGVIELGIPGFAGEQTVINVGTGVVVAVTGLVASWILAWWRMPRGLVIGVCVGALLLGAACAFSFYG